ncbi:uncharacterized protein PpBr36_10257 [Pyricularia pennisetigena]|uniref:uncharacterized protein n=1 Tax=Pyricularia pennisetigena TaxID=1578925 RepID=UPI0011508FCE|nr:uncharacterized protein PpBr36_10257 [Pyricularia pennisetigena]TLS21539.1 hypothetical protein PpBr36_10257 [Pyricularia pennisetigena]
MHDITFSASVSVQMLLAFLVLVLIGARFYLKLAIQRKSLEATDYLVFSAWLCAFIASTADIVMLHANVPDDTLASFANYETSNPEILVFILKVRDLYYAIDNYVFLIVACLPPLRPYLNLMSGSSAPSSRQTKSSQGSSAGAQSQDLQWRNSQPWRQPTQLSPISPNAPVARLGSTDTLEGRGAGAYDYELEDMPRGGVAVLHV